MGSAKNKMLFCYICRKLDFSPTQPLHPSKGGTKVPLPFHIMKMPDAEKDNLFFAEPYITAKNYLIKLNSFIKRPQADQEI